MDSLTAHGVRWIFGNPGTTETPLLDSLADYPDIGYCVALHEGIATAAAGFYAQASRQNAVVSLHVAPGLGNAMGSLYGAFKADSPIVVTAGQQDTRMRLRDPILGHDLVAMAQPVTKWAVQVERGDEMAAIMARAFKVANTPPTGPVFVALPIDVMEQETGHAAYTAGNLYMTGEPSAPALDDAAELVRAAHRPVIVAGDEVARYGAVDALVRFCETIGAGVWLETLHTHAAFPNRHPHALGNLPLEAENIRAELDDADLVILIGGPFFEEVWFTPGSALPDGARVLHLETSDERLAHNFPADAGLAGDLHVSLTALSERLEDLPGAAARRTALAAASAQRQTRHEERLRGLWNQSPMTPLRALHELAAAIPPDAIVVDESITAFGDVVATMDLARPGDYYGCRGGGIGQGIAGAIGVKIAEPERPVVAISGDGSAMYSIQALWTALHHDLAIVFVILANREYRVLKHNADIYRASFDAPSNKPYPHMDLSDPTLDFAELARSFGMPARTVQAPEEVGPALGGALASGGPAVLELIVRGKG